MSELHCGYCKGLKVDARKLTCNHSFCKNCLQNFPISTDFKGENLISCPTCYTDTIILISVICLPTIDLELQQKINEEIERNKKKGRFMKLWILWQ